jgi:hypothetical protein
VSSRRCVAQQGTVGTSRRCVAQHGTVGIALALALPCSAGAQAPADVARGGAGEERSWFAPLFGFHVGAPQKAALGLGVVRAWATGSGFAGVTLMAEGGLGGGRVSVGALGFGGPAVSVQLRGSVVRTWGEPWVVAPGQTYAGPELRVGAVLLTAGAGYYWRQGGGAPGDDRFFGASIGVGF